MGKRISDLLKNWKFQVVFIAVMVLLGYMIVRQRVAREPEFAVRKYFECLEARDAGCISSLTSASERAVGAPTDYELQKFFDEVFDARMKGYKRNRGSTKEDGLDPSVMVVEYQEYKNADGETASIGVCGYRTEGKAAVWPNFASLLLLIIQTYKEPGEAIGRNDLYLRALSDLAPKLEAIGIEGVFLNDSFEGHFYTWSEWQTKLSSQK